MSSPSRVRGLSTFSIVAFDPRNGDLGVAVQSKFPAVGAVVPWAKAKVGAVATQAWANVSYGPVGIKLLEEGLSAKETLNKLLVDDDYPEVRQTAVVDAKGEAAAHTGSECLEWAGHVTGEGYSCQGNILASSKVVESMARVYEETSGDLIDKLLEALSAAQAPVVIEGGNSQPPSWSSETKEATRDSVIDTWTCELTNTLPQSRN